MVIAAVALIFANPLDLKAMVTQRPAELVARWGTPVREEMWSWSGSYDRLPQFGDIAKFRDTAPVPDWTRRVSYMWKDTPALKNDGLIEAGATIQDGVATIVSVTTMARPGTRETLREDIYKGLGLVAPPAKKISAGSEHFSGVKSQEPVLIWSDENALSELKKGEPRVQFFVSVYLPLPKELEPAAAKDGQAATCTVAFSPQGEPKGIDYTFLPIVDTSRQSMASVGIAPEDLEAAPSGQSSFKLSSSRGWRGSWIKDEFYCLLAFDKEQIVGSKLRY